MAADMKGNCTSEDASPSAATGYNAGVGDSMRGLKTLTRFGLEWEWMSEGKDGEYVRYAVRKLDA